MLDARRDSEVSTSIVERIDLGPLSILDNPANLASVNSWPSYVPDGCPPPDAPEASGDVYRLIKGDSPSPDDFLPKVLEEPDGDFTGKECMAGGLSVYRKKKDLARLLTLPTFKGKPWQVARATLSPAVGRLKPTPPRKIRNSHHTWWWPEGVDPTQLFVLDEPTPAGAS
jgi:hypothetical protein